MNHQLSDRIASKRRGAILVGAVLLALIVLIVVAPILEARRLEITRPVVHIPGLPQEFAGLRVALVADVHRGPFMSEQRVRDMAHLTNEQKPDVIALAGDYIHRSKSYIPSVWSAFSELRAPLGVYAILGNHDHWEDTEMSVQSMAEAGVTNVTNRNVRLERGGKAIYIAGLDDPWAGQPDLDAALKGIGPKDIVILICHNPDYIEQVQDPRIKLWLSGHTHGGQVCLPEGRPLINISRCGLRYVSGLAECDGMQIYTSRGIGTVTPPMRWNCPAELPIIELQPG